MSETSRTTKVLALSMGGTLNKLALIVSGVLAARILSKQDFATMKQTMLIYSFVSPILILGLSEALFYFLPKEKKSKKSIVIDNLFLLFILSIAFSSFLYFGGGNLIAGYFHNDDLLITLKWLVPYPMFVMPSVILGAVLVSQNKVFVFTLYQVISKLLIVSIVIFSIVLTKNYKVPLLVQIYSPLFLLPVVLILVFKNVSGKFTLPNKKSMGRLLKYSIPLGLSGMLGTMTLMIDKLIVSTMCTTEKFANYVNGAIEIPLIGIITGSIASIILVDMVKYIDSGDKTKALMLFKKAASKSAMILLPVMVFLIITGKAFILTLYSEKYLESIYPFYIYLFILPIRIVVYGSAMMALGQTKAILFRSVFDLLINIILSIIFVKLFGYLGAAIATIITLYFWTVPFNLYKIGQGFGFKALHVLPIKQIVQLLAMSILASPLSLIYILNSEHPWWIQLFISGILYFPLVGIMLLKFKIIEIPNKLNQKLPYFLRSKL